MPRTQPWSFFPAFLLPTNRGPSRNRGTPVTPVVDESADCILSLPREPKGAAMGKRLSLDTIVNVLLALTCLVVLGKYVVEWRDSGRTTRNAIAKALPVGTQIVGLEGVAWKDRNIVLFARSTCHYCTESMPFYRELTDQAQTAGVAFIAASEEPQDVMKGYLSSHGVKPDKVVSAPLGVLASIGVHATPTLAIVDSHGTVIESWVGVLPAGTAPRVKSLAGLH